MIATLKISLNWKGELQRRDKLSPIFVDSDNGGRFCYSGPQFDLLLCTVGTWAGTLEEMSKSGAFQEQDGRKLHQVRRNA